MKVEWGKCSCWVRRLVSYSKRKSLSIVKNRPLQDLLFIYMLFAMMFFTLISMGINVLIDIPADVKNLNYATFVLLAAFLGFSLNNKYLKLVRYLFVIMASVIISVFWFESAGSGGASVLFTHGFVTILIFIAVGREFYISVSAIILLTILLFASEYYNPSYIQPYLTHQQRIIDVFSVAMLLYVVEIPLLIYARNNLFNQRNTALEVAEKRAIILAQMSHEIRTPMNAIIGFTELLADEDLSKSDHDYYLSIVNQNSRTLLNLLNNVISASKFDAGLAQVYISKCNANKITQTVFDTLKFLNLKTEITLSTQLLNDNDTCFEADENLIFQVLINLGYNAIKFTESGIIVLKIEKNADEIIFSVKDSGNGIPREKQPSVFKRYRQLSASDNLNPMNGAGLGLSICSEIIELLHGEIWFESEEGIGSEFFVKLPIKSSVKNCDLDHL